MNDSELQSFISVAEELAEEINKAEESFNWSLHRKSKLLYHLNKFGIKDKNDLYRLEKDKNLRFKWLSSIVPNGEDDRADERDQIKEDAIRFIRDAYKENKYEGRDRKSFLYLLVKKFDEKLAEEIIAEA